MRKTGHCVPSEPIISGAWRMHHIENCVRCSTSVSGVWPFWLQPSQGRSVGQPTTRKSGSLKAPGPVTAPSNAMQEIVFRILSKGRGSGWRLRVRQLYAKMPLANSMMSPTPLPPPPLNTACVPPFLPSPQTGARSLPSGRYAFQIREETQRSGAGFEPLLSKLSGSGSNLTTPHVALVGDVIVVPGHGAALLYPLTRWIPGCTIRVIYCPRAGKNHPKQEDRQQRLDLEQV